MTVKLSEEQRLKRNASQREYRKTPKGKAYYKRYLKEYNLKRDWSESAFTKIKYKAKMKGYDFNLVLEDFKVPEVCPILGIPITVRSSQDLSPSIDRIDNSKGYVKGNTHIISGRANRLKSDASLKELGQLYHYFDSLTK